jgi:hypothetical protein
MATLADLDKYRYKFDPLPPEEEAIMNKLGLRRAQWEIYRHPARFRIVCMGRRGGKTETLIAEMVRAAQTGYNRNILYCAPFAKQARTIMWKKLLQAIPRNMIASKNETHMELTIKGWNSTIKCGGADNGDSLRGSGVHMACLDEAADMNEDIWYEIIRPMLSDTMGEAVIVGTPKGRSGLFYRLYTEAEQDETGEWKSFSFTSIDGGNIPDQEILSAMRSMGWSQFSQEYLASFNSSIGLVYSNFERAHHISKEVKDHGGKIVVGMDFNVAPLCAVIGQFTADGQLHIFDELEMWGAHTQMAAQELLDRYPNREIWVYPDPSGRQRRTSAGGQTDFTILTKAGFRVIAPSRTPPVRDRINVLQMMLLNAEGERRVKIHPRCKTLIQGLDSFSYMETGKPDKNMAGTADDITDALSFITWSECNFRRTRVGMAKLGGVY